MARQKEMVMVDATAEEELGAAMRQALKEELGKDYLGILYPQEGDDARLPEVAHVIGRPPSINRLLYVAWRQETYKKWENWKKRRKPGVPQTSSNIIPTYLRYTIGLQRKGRLEYIKGLVGEALQKARSVFRLHREK